MNSADSRALKRALENQIRRLNKKVSELETWSKRISFFRLIDPLFAVVLIYFAAQAGNTILFTLILAAGIAVFMLLVYWHRKIDRSMDEFAGLSDIREQHLARLALDWQGIPSAEEQSDFSDHPYARDFDITGNRSLLHLVDTTTYAGASSQLREWLLTDQPDLPSIKKRQRLLKELKPMAHFRDRLHLYSNISRQKKAGNDWDMPQLLFWLRNSQREGFVTPLIIMGSLSALNIVLLIGAIAGLIAPYVIISFVIYLLTYNFFSDKFDGISDEAAEIRKLLQQFRDILLYLESFSYTPGSRLKSFCSVYLKEDRKPSHYLKKIIRLASAAAIQESDLGRLLLNSLVPWDMYFAKKLNEYKAELEPRLTQWLDRFYELEALNSLANFAWLNPDYAFSLPHENSRKDTPVFEAEALGHPLIPKEQKVANDVTIKHTGDIHLITGSNMAGKSTFLRTIGINLVLCFAGAPVNASRLSTIPFRLFSSINVTDSLDEGLSHFYAEVKRLRGLLDELDQPHAYPLCFMVDEIYRGTNNRERLAGSEALLKHVAGKNGIGFVSTHDLELAGLEQEIPELSNWHFVETIEKGKMGFEYKLKQGPCPSTNALKIMDMEGLPVGGENYEL